VHLGAIGGALDFFGIMLDILELQQRAKENGRSVYDQGVIEDSEARGATIIDGRPFF
jgi:hypothetical protein